MYHSTHLFGGPYSISRKILKVVVCSASLGQPLPTAVTFPKKSSRMTAPDANGLGPYHTSGAAPAAAAKRAAGGSAMGASARSSAKRRRRGTIAGLWLGLGQPRPATLVRSVKALRAAAPPVGSLHYIQQVYSRWMDAMHAPAHAACTGCGLDRPLSDCLSAGVSGAGSAPGGPTHPATQRHCRHTWQACVVACGRGRASSPRYRLSHAGESLPL